MCKTNYNKEDSYKVLSRRQERKETPYFQRRGSLGGSTKVVLFFTRSLFEWSHILGLSDIHSIVDFINSLTFQL